MLSGSVVRRGQTVQDIANNGERAVPLGGQPFLKRFGIDVEVGQEFAPIETGRRLQLRSPL